MSDGFYRKTESLIVAVRVAMRELENASMGAVGDNGPSLDEMDLRVARTGLPWEGNADYETMQRAWRILEAGLRDYVVNAEGHASATKEKVSQPGDVWVEREPVDVVKHLCGHLRGVLDMLGTCDNFDHHGYCQSHFVESPCRVAKAREFLESLSNNALHVQPGREKSLA